MEEAEEERADGCEGRRRRPDQTCRGLMVCACSVLGDFPPSEAELSLAAAERRAGAAAGIKSTGAVPRWLLQSVESPATTTGISTIEAKVARELRAVPRLPSFAESGANANADADSDSRA